MPLATSLLLVPLEDIVLFPNMSATLTIDVGNEPLVLLVPKHEGEYAKVGTIAEVTDSVRLDVRPGFGIERTSQSNTASLTWSEVPPWPDPS